MEPTQVTEIQEQVNIQMVPQSKQTLSIPAAIIIAGVMISASIFISNLWHPGSANTAAGAPAAVKVDIKNVTMAGEPFIGNPNAPALAYFSDYQCPFCKKFDTTILPDLKTKYVDTGKLKIVFKDFTFLGPDSVTAALFGRAVWNLYPDQYFAWREAMYVAQDAEGNIGFGNRKSIETLTKTIPGIDQAKVSAAVDANTIVYQKSIDADYAEGQKLGVAGTPSVIVGTVAVSGLDALPTYIAAIGKVVK